MDLAPVPRDTKAAVDTAPAMEMEVVPRDTRALVPVPRVLATDPVLREAPNLDHTMDTLEVATEEMAVDPANITTADWLLILSTDLDPREVPKAARNLDRTMDPAQAMAVPRATKVAVAPREDPIPRDIRDLDRMTVLREAAMVLGPKEVVTEVPNLVLNPVLNRDRNLDLMTVKMEVVTEEVMEAVMEMAEELVAIMPTEEMTRTATLTR